MNKKMVFGLVLILGISIGYWSTTRTVGICSLRLGYSRYPYNKNDLNDSILNVNGYEEYSVLVDYSYAELEAMIYQIQKKKEREPFISRILIQFYGNSMESIEIQKMVESKFDDLNILYMQIPHKGTKKSVRLGITY
jgi:hypothetical protein